MGSASFKLPPDQASPTFAHISEFIAGEAENGLYVLRYDDALTDPQAIVAAVTAVGYRAALNAENGS
ncbi:hypothetical protein [Sulfitobacter sp. D7]|uniref:hypothetical protein n=1 Tax=Sulfitobacter sp. D7 TaxID=1968541 RepID=UPI000E778027|nr:hypothetical protein [Sulfitobacter sp. D7]AYE85834.1 hypothetical protein B5M07_06770 [Sulfitobacter sp. D7]